jgi:hypothetical protein
MAQLDFMLFTGLKASDLACSSIAVSSGDVC